MSRRIEIYDTTFRDGSQQNGISFSTHAKLGGMHRLDCLGVPYIELGWPGSNEKDTQVFQEARRERLCQARLVAFGMTCSPRSKKPEDDQQLAKLLAAGTEVVALVGKSSARHVTNVLGIDLQRNLQLIEESCRFMVRQGRTVFFDAEHFFDGFKKNSGYALACLMAAQAGGASTIVLCDTNGGAMPWEISSAVQTVVTGLKMPVGIHTHNDGEMAVANSLVAVQAGATQVQGTINGYGERCGNTNLCSLIPALEHKMGISCLPKGNIGQLTDLARFTAELANMPLPPNQPYVGRDAFRHKAGLHVNATAKDPGSYLHFDPAIVGNNSSVAVSELSGRSNVVMKAKEFGINLTTEQVGQVLALVEKMENIGFQFEGAEGSLKLMMLSHTKEYKPPFEVIERDVSSRQSGSNDPVDSAIVKLQINGELVHHVANGDGPVNALDNALRKALLPSFPYLEKTKLIDYKVRVLPGDKGTGKAVRILIDFSDGQEEWTTVGCSSDSIEANLQALVDGFKYAILRKR